MSILHGASLAEREVRIPWSVPARWFVGVRPTDETTPPDAPPGPSGGHSCARGTNSTGGQLVRVGRAGSLPVARKRARIACWG